MAGEPGWRGRLARVAVGLVVGLLLAEAAARLLPAGGGAQLLMSAPENAPDGLYSVDHALVNLPTPGFDAVSRSPGYAARITINRFGLRGPDPGLDLAAEGSAVPAPRNDTRWLVAGDSFTFAAQLDATDAFPSRLRAGRTWLHGGADGWSTWQPGILYRRLDAELALDGLLVVLFLGNDLTDNATFQVRRPPAQQRPDGQVLAMPPSPAVTRLLSRRSYLWGRVRMWQRQRMLADPRSPERLRWAQELRAFTRAGPPRHEVQQTEAALRALKDAVGADGLVVAIAPPAFAVDPVRLDATWRLVGLDPAQAQPDRARDLVAELLQRLGIRACDLTDALRASVQRGEDPYFTYDGHWNAVGHARVAQRLEACLGEP
jgi:hypothetical protein